MKHLCWFIAFYACILFDIHAFSLVDYNLLPVPQEVRFGKSYVKVKAVSVDLPAWTGQWCEFFNEYGVDVDTNTGFKVTGRIIGTVPGVKTDNDEAYRLEIRQKNINVVASSEKGIYWALQTLRQIVKPGIRGTIVLPECTIADWPEFRIRGVMMDVGRTYVSMEELKRHIRLLSHFKVNVYHWHLTENQAWRLESRRFPALNDSAVTERDPGKYYTIEEARELVRYAAEHNMLLLPEIDMPGHSAAFVRTFGCDMQSDKGMEILKSLVDEACETFSDVPYLHIGTDEVKFTNPRFVPEMVEFVRNKGKKAVSWNPGWQYAPGEIDLVQMWSYRGKALPGIPAVDSRFHYINHFDTYADIVALYRSSIYGHKSGSDDIAGTEIALWNDRFIPDEQSMIAQNNFYPVSLAMAERAWLGGGTEYFDSLGTNMAPSGTDDFNRFADFERRLLWHKDNTLSEVKIPYVKQTDVHWRITDAFPNGGNLDAVFPPETEGLRDRYVYDDSVYSTRPATGAGIYLRHVWGATVPAFYSDPKPNHTAYAFTRVYSPVDQTVGLQAETQNYSRSESDLPPRQGTWDYRGSRIMVNGSDIAPPVWTSSHVERDNEIPLGNENFSAREPILVKLNKGWNQVMLKLPIGAFTTPETRLVKWMFTFVFTTPDGRHAAPGLIYSPDRKL